MKVFFDECVPRPLRRLLPGHEILTAHRRIAIMVLSTNYWPVLRTQTTLIESALTVLHPGQYIEVEIAG